MIIFEDLGGKGAEYRGDGVVRLSPSLTLEQVLIVVREAILFSNGEHHRTKYLRARGFTRDANGVPRPDLTAHDGGGKPDRRRTRRPKLGTV